MAAIDPVNTYTRTNWTPRMGSNLNTFIITDANTPNSTSSITSNSRVTLVGAPDEVTQSGTKFSDDNMNKLEKGVEEVTNAVGKVIEKLNSLNALPESPEIVTNNTVGYASIASKIGNYIISSDNNESSDPTWSIASIGSENQPVYVDANGVVTAATPYVNASVAEANQLTNAINIGINNADYTLLQTAGSTVTLELPPNASFDVLDVNTLNATVTEAQKLTSTNIGSNTIPVYFNENGIPIQSVYSNSGEINSIKIGEIDRDLDDKLSEIDHINLMNKVININKSSILGTDLNNLLGSLGIGDYSVSGNLIYNNVKYNLIKISVTNLNNDLDVRYYVQQIDGIGTDVITGLTNSDNLSINVIILL